MSETQSKNETVKSWVLSYSDDLLRWALYKIADKGQAEDLVQETFLSAFKSFDSFKGNSNPKTWLFRILNNKIIDYYRKASNRNEQTGKSDDLAALQMTDSLFDKNGTWKPESLKQDWDNQEHLLDNLDFKEVLSSCLNDLPETWRKAVLSKYILEKSGKEICQELEISPSNYWQLVHRAKLALKNCLENKWFKK